MQLNRQSKIYVAGHGGLVGSAICKELLKEGFTNLIVRARCELDLLDADAVRCFLKSERPEYIFLSAARVGGIRANSQYPAEFIYQNLQIQNNLIHLARVYGVKKLLFLGSSCIYPKLAPQPLKEEYLLAGALEPTNEWYAIAKIAGIKMCQAYRRQYGCNFINVMPTNLYGPNDNYDIDNSHVLPALLRRFHEAKVSNSSQVTCWGTGAALREFLHSEDVARACVFLMERYNEEEVINVGSGEEISISDLATLIKDVVGFSGEIVWDKSKPDGTPRKVLDTSKLSNLGWRPLITLKSGIVSTYQSFITGCGALKPV